MNACYYYLDLVQLKGLRNSVIHSRSRFTKNNPYQYFFLSVLQKVRNTFNTKEATTKSDIVNKPEILKSNGI